MTTITPAFLSRVSQVDPQGSTRIAGGKIYILPTRAGMVFATALIVMLLGSLNYASNVGLAFTFIFAGVAIVGMVHTWRNLLDLKVEAIDAPPIFLGQPTSFPVRLSESNGLGRAAIVVTTNDRADAPAMDLAINDSVDIELCPVPQQRGRYLLGTLCISSTFPLGLFRAWAYANTSAAVLVYPAPIAAHKWQPTVRFIPALQGGTRGVGVEDFIGLRSYRVGDSLKHLDWKALARGRGPVTRQFGGDRHEEILLDWDAVGPGTIEERLGRLCRLILDAVALNLSFGLRLPGINLPSAAGDAHKHRCLAQLALFVGESTSDIR